LSESLESAPVPVPAESPVIESESRRAAIWREAKGLFWVLVAVLAFHSFIAKPFYIPSESMMPGLLTGDRLVVSKYPFGWSWVSPSFHVFPHWQGRLFGRMPERGDVVIVTPPGGSSDYIKRVIGLPGDTIELRAGQLILNGRPVKSELRPPAMIPVDANSPCGIAQFWDRIVETEAGAFCRLPIVRETLPNGVTYDTIDDGRSQGDDFAKIVIPPDHLFLMGDNRDHSADSRFSLAEEGLGGPVPWENIGGRAEFITFSLDGTTQIANPLTWFSAFRSGRAGHSLRAAKE